jgi:hypothetical protein
MDGRSRHHATRAWTKCWCFVNSSGRLPFWERNERRRQPAGVWRCYMMVDESGFSGGAGNYRCSSPRSILHQDSVTLFSVYALLYSYWLRDAPTLVVYAGTSQHDMEPQTNMAPPPWPPFRSLSLSIPIQKSGGCRGGAWPAARWTPNSRGRAR